MPQDRHVAPSDLVIPIYLDIPATVSLVAALEGGVAYGRKYTEGRRRLNTAEASAKGEASIPIISSLLRLGVSGELTGRHEGETTDEEQIERQHTAASLFNELRMTLQHNSTTVRDIQSPEDLNNLPNSGLVTLSGRVLTDPVLQLAEALSEIAETLRNLTDISALADIVEGMVQLGIAQARQKEEVAANPYSKLMLSSLEPRKSETRPALQSARSSKKPTPQRTTSSEPNQPIVEVVRQGGKLLTKLRDDLRSSPVKDLVMISGQVKGVIVLTQDYLQTQSLGQMVDANVHVLGKVTRVLAELDKLDLLRRSLLRYLSPSVVDRAYTVLRERKFLNLELSEFSITAPAVQILPIAVYV